jgi:hypothetical protein
MDYKYFLLLRTAESEFKSWKNLEEKKYITPIVEITRGRKKPKIGNKKEPNDYISKGEYYFYEKHLDGIKEIINSSFAPFVDITSEETLMCGELSDLIKEENGYKNWIEFLENNFNTNVVPILQVTPPEEEQEIDEDILYDRYKSNLILQFETLSKKYSSMAYRAYVQIDKSFLEDLSILSNNISSYVKNNNFFLILDYDNLRPDFSLSYSLEASKIINEVLSKIPEIKVIILSNSFPKNITERSQGDKYSFKIEEFLLFNNIIKNSKYKENIFYGDYGSINSIRNDDKVMARGWVPRIDVPFNDHITFYKEKREERTYGLTYHIVAKNLKKDGILDNLPDCWAKKQIEEAAKGEIYVNGKSPRFWISVRTQLHILNIQKQIEQIYNKD